MDHSLKPAILTGFSLSMLLSPVAFGLDKERSAFLFLLSAIGLGYAAHEYKMLLPGELEQRKIQVLQEEIANAELAATLMAELERIEQRFLALPDPEPTRAAPQTGAIAKLEQSLTLTDRLLDELIQRERSAAAAPPAAKPISQGGAKLLDYLRKKGEAIDLRTLTKNWGRNHEFNQKEVKSYCEELVRLECAVWSGDGIIKAI